MTGTLIEAVARAINPAAFSDERSDDTKTQAEYWFIQRAIAVEKARAAIAAIEAAGYRIVPVEPTTSMKGDAWRASGDAGEYISAACVSRMYAALLAAAPKVIP